MAIVLNKSEEVKQRLNNIKNVQVLNSASDIAMINSVNQQMENVRREYQIKDRESQISASQVILTA